MQQVNRCGLGCSSSCGPNLFDSLPREKGGKGSYWRYVWMPRVEAYFTTSGSPYQSYHLRLRAWIHESCEVPGRAPDASKHQMQPLGQFLFLKQKTSVCIISVTVTFNLTLDLIWKQESELWHVTLLGEAENGSDALSEAQDEALHRRTPEMVSAPEMWNMNQERSKEVQVFGYLKRRERSSPSGSYFLSHRKGLASHS